MPAEASTSNVPELDSANTTAATKTTELATTESVPPAVDIAEPVATETTEVANDVLLNNENNDIGSVSPTLIEDTPAEASTTNVPELDSANTTAATKTTELATTESVPPAVDIAEPVAKETTEVANDVLLNNENNAILFPVIVNHVTKGLAVKNLSGRLLASNGNLKHIQKIANQSLRLTASHLSPQLNAFTPKRMTVLLITLNSHWICQVL
ncbi:hypothetical protein F2Q69_00019056 [Brassica cretica]|uniref:Uncharacterized protein n=1 Tax=Brassica cretica TaxID=69181 RepID=A0A8S9QN41_BRACR|nr:hypothetical protein F2Q69_00019056 [Brassica cretica]